MAIDVTAVRREFPFLETCLYLNTAAAGAAPRGTGAAVSRFYDEMLSRGYEGRDDWRAVGGRVQQRLGMLLGVNPADVGFAGSTTEALNLIAHALPLDPGDRVVVADDEFPSVDFALSALAARGAEVVRVAIPDEMSRAEVLAAAADKARYLGVSHVHWQTGTRLDLDALAAACRAGGCAMIVDGIQALGATGVDASRADAYVASVFKWLLAGFGLAIVVTKPAFRNSLTPAFRGYFNPPPSRELRYGHISYPVLCALESSLSYMEELGWSAVFEQTASLRDQLMERLTRAGIAFATPRDAAAGIVAIQADNAEALSAALRQRNVFAEARGPVLRASPHFYNTADEIERFVGHLQDLRKDGIS